MGEGAHSGGVVLAIDQGTTGSTAVVLDRDVRVVGRANVEFPQHYPQPGWVEHDPKDIWSSVGEAVTQALAQAGVAASDIAAIGITNQRETTLVWDRATGEAIHRAIVWQCRRTSSFCAELKDAGHEALVRERTGLVLDPYFSGTKLRWMLDHVDGARGKAEAGALAFGTVDTYLVWRLTGGQSHVTDVSNASRTLLMALETTDWDPELLDLFGVPAAVLPEIVSSSQVVGHTSGLSFLPDGIPVAGIAGDQQAALFGQACFEAGQAKCTYGTGAFVLMNTGSEIARSERGLLTTVAWRLGEGPTLYALEGSVFIAGAAVQWLRDELCLIEQAPQVEALAQQVPDSGGVYVVPAFAGLGAPYWDPEARGAVLGLTRGSSKAHLARATLEGIAHQVSDVVEAMEADAGRSLAGLRVDGGAAANNLLMQTQADLLGSGVTRPQVLETTGLGAAFLGGLGVGFWSDPEEVSRRWCLDRAFAAQADDTTREAARSGWKAAVGRLLS